MVAVAGMVCTGFLMQWLRLAQIGNGFWLAMDPFGCSPFLGSALAGPYIY